MADIKRRSFLGLLAFLLPAVKVAAAKPEVYSDTAMMKSRGLLRIDAYRDIPIKVVDKLGSESFPDYSFGVPLPKNFSGLEILEQYAEIDRGIADA